MTTTISLAHRLARRGRTSIVGPHDSLDIKRATQYENAIEAAKRSGVQHLVHYGVVGAPRPRNPFVVAPFLVYAEAALRTNGLAWTILRYGLYAEPSAAWVDDIVAMGTIPYPIGDSRAAFVTRTDIGRAGAAVLAGTSHEGHVYTLTGPTTYGVAELCRIVSQVTGGVCDSRQRHRRTLHRGLCQRRHARSHGEAVTHPVPRPPSISKSPSAATSPTGHGQSPDEGSQSRTRSMEACRCTACPGSRSRFPDSV